jgi:Zn-dependent peptidase ImmA (M78 family)
MEREANQFAAELLMPEEEFIKQAETKNIDGLSDYFGTSLEAIGFRALNLGIKLTY